jgi:hypothetical protein
VAALARRLVGQARPSKSVVRFEIFRIWLARSFETHAFVCALCVQVAKRKEPLQPKQDTAPRFAKQNGALPGVANRNGVLSGEANQNGALSGGENKSIVLATQKSIVKLLPAPRSDVILPSGDMEPGTVAPTTTPAPPLPSPASNFLSPPYAPELDTVGNVELTEKNIAEPEGPFPPFAIRSRGHLGIQEIYRFR